jgi:hypothetical protein
MQPDDQTTLRGLLEAALKQLNEETSTAERVAGNVAAKPNARSQDVEAHPGLERFPLSGLGPAAPSKPCFMEPGRLCVNSGACEMRGY